MLFPTCYSKSYFRKSDVSRFGSTVAEALHLDRIDGRSYVVDTPLFGNHGYYVNGHDAAACDDTVNYDVSRCCTLDKSSSCPQQRSAAEGSSSWLSACKLGASYFLDGTDSSARRRRQERNLRSRLFANICFDTNDSGAASSPLGDGGASALSGPADASVLLSDSLEEDSAAAKPSAAGECSTSESAGNVSVAQWKNDMNCQFSSSSPGNHNASFKKAVDPHCIDVIDSSCVNDDSMHHDCTSRPVSDSGGHDASSSVTSSLRRSSFRSGYFDRSGIHVPGGGGSDDMSTYCVDGGDGFAQLSGQEMRANAMRQAERGTVCLDRAEFPAWLGCKNKTTLNVR